LASFSALRDSTWLSYLRFIKVFTSINLNWVLNIFLLRCRLRRQLTWLWTYERPFFSFTVDLLNHLEISLLIEFWRLRSLSKELVSLYYLLLTRPWLKLISCKNSFLWIFRTQIIQSNHLLLLPRWSESVL